MWEPKADGRNLVGLFRMEQRLTPTQELTESDGATVGLFAAINVGLAGASKLVDNIGPILHDILTAGQCAVAVVTVIYVWRKAKILKIRKAIKVAKKKSKKKPIRY